MKILGLDSSGLVAGVAVVEDDVLLAEYTTNYKKTHSQTLLPMLDELRTMIELDLNTVDAVAIASGPGSFTGLRIGSATAKGLGLALGKPLVEVPTLEGLAWNMWGACGLVCPLMDARRNQIYGAAYEFIPVSNESSNRACTDTNDNRINSTVMRMPRGVLSAGGACPAPTEAEHRPDTPQLCCASSLTPSQLDAGSLISEGEKFRLQTVIPQNPMDITEFVDKLNEIGRSVVFLGDGVPVYLPVIREHIKVPYHLAPASANRQRAACIASLGAVYFAEGKTVSAAEHKPEYLRKSQAEQNAK